MVPLQQCQVFFPGQIILLYDFRVLKLQKDIVEIGTEGLSKEPFYIFKDECLGLCFTDSSHCLWEHITFIVICFVLTSQRERLARRSPGYKLNFAHIAIVTYGAYISLEYRPILYVGIAVGDVTFDIFAGVFVPLEKGFVIKTCLLQPEGKATCSAE